MAGYPKMSPYFQQMLDNLAMRSEATFGPIEKGGETYTPFPAQQRFAPRNVFERKAANLTKRNQPHRPFMRAARDYSNQAAEQFPQHYQRYMDPYQEAVVNRISELGNRNFDENILPALEAKFVRLGQHGSSRHGLLASHAARDVQSEISARQAEALSHGYGQAMQAFNADQARLMDAARQQAELGAQSTAERLAELSNLRQQAMMERAQAERPMEYAEAQHQAKMRFPFQQRAAHANILYGLPSHMAPYDVRRSLHKRDYQNLGLRLGASLISNRFKPTGDI